MEPASSSSAKWQNRGGAMPTLAPSLSLQPIFVPQTQRDPPTTEDGATRPGHISIWLTPCSLSWPNQSAASSPSNTGGNNCYRSLSASSFHLRTCGPSSSFELVHECFFQLYQSMQVHKSSHVAVHDAILPELVSLHRDCCA